MKRKEPYNTQSDEDKTAAMECQEIENPRKMSRQDPVQKDQKYDRQLRLWGNNGQQALEQAHVCLINATATATEALKALVLPGVGRYFIVDNSNVTVNDLCNNFFVDSESVGKPRAQVTCELLQELNPDSMGGWVQRDPVTMLESDPEYFRKFTVVICSGVNEKDLLKISNYLWRYNIPMLITETIGFLGYLRVIAKEHVVIESHPDNTLEDLRLDYPFPELVEYFDNIKIEEMEHLEHSHTPYLVILYKALQCWRQQTGSDWPQNYKEKCQIKDIVKQMIMKNTEGIPLDEENYEEALRNVNNVFIRTRVPSDVVEILESNMANNPLNSEENSKFWILVRALKEFVNQHSILPLRGSLPDMFSDSKRFIELQNIYKGKADCDADLVSEYTKEALRDIQLDEGHITQEEIRSFCKNSAFLKVFRSISYHDEIKQALSERKIQGTLEMNLENGVDVYIVFRTVHKYFDQMTVNNGTEIDLDKMCSIAAELIKELGLSIEAPKDLLSELNRVDFGELHSVAAIMGGICAQEVVKLITRQYVVLNNTFLLNQISCTTATLML